MKKKYIIYLIIVALLAALAANNLILNHINKKLAVYAPSDGNMVTMYSSDGRLCRVLSDYVENFKNVGWYENIEDAAVVKYAENGQKIVVFNDDAADFFDENDKWKNIYDASTVLYDAQSRPERVFLNDVEEYLQNGYTRAPKTLDSSMPMIAITFDDGPSVKQTPRLLDICEKYDARVTFFVLGSRAESAPEILARAKSLGCEVGSHTYGHKLLVNLPNDKIINEIASTSQIIENATGLPPSSLRPPYGSYNDTVAKCANSGIVLWSVDTLDWKTGDADQTLNSILSTARDGDIVLLHDIYAASVDAAERAIPALQSRGYVLVTAEELIKLRCGGIENGAVYRNVKNK